MAPNLLLKGFDLDSWPHVAKNFFLTPDLVCSGILTSCVIPNARLPEFWSSY